MNIIRYGLILFLVSAFSGLSLSLMYTKTAEKVKETKEARIYKLQQEVLPDAVTFQAQENSNITLGYNGEGAEVGKIVSTASFGYGGNIEILVGVTKNNEVVSVKIVSHNETPGLGANIKKDAFLSQFSMKKLKQLVLRKDSSDGEIDAITGATISSRAVLEGVKKALAGNEEPDTVSSASKDWQAKENAK